MNTIHEVTGTAAVQGALWGARARDWADIQEEGQRGQYPPVLEAAGVGEGTRLLDVGCGSGVAARVARDRGARVEGIDAALPAIEIARTRVPDGDFHVGEMEALPYDDGSFDVVTGFNSFQYAADPVHAVSEAGRVARSGGVVAIQAWGAPEACQAAAVLKAVGSLLPPPPPGTPGPFALSEPGALEALATRAGLTVRETGEVTTRWDYPDRDTVLRAFTSGGPIVKAIDVVGEERVRAAVGEALAPFRTPDGRYVIENTWRHLLATA